MATVYCGTLSRSARGKCSCDVCWVAFFLALRRRGDGSEGRREGGWRPRHASRVSRSLGERSRKMGSSTCTSTC